MRWVALLGACSSTTSGTPTPASTGTSAGAASARPPLDPEPYRTKPCELVPASLPQSLGFSAPGQTVLRDPTVTMDLGQSCDWKEITDTAKSAHVQILPRVNPQASRVDTAVHNFQIGLLAYADVTDVLGYRSVFFDVRDNREKGDCSITVELGNGEDVGATANGFPGKDNSCGNAKQLATAAVKTLEGS